MVEGVTYLHKEYGPLHWVYSVYLFVSFGIMLAVITQSVFSRRVTTHKQAGILAVLTLGNMGVWFVEQLVDTNFEFLSVSYVVTEIFLVSLSIMAHEYEQTLVQSVPGNEENPMPPDMIELLDSFGRKAAGLTYTERAILRHYGDGLDVPGVAEAMFISIHTVRKHNANIYHKRSFLLADYPKETSRGCESYTN